MRTARSSRGSASCLPLPAWIGSLTAPGAEAAIYTTVTGKVDERYRFRNGKWRLGLTVRNGRPTLATLYIARLQLASGRVLSPCVLRRRVWVCHVGLWRRGGVSASL